MTKDDIQNMAKDAGFSSFHQRQLRHLIARLCRAAYIRGLEDAAGECEYGRHIVKGGEVFAAAIRGMKA